MSTESQSFLPIIAHLLEAAVADGKGYEPIIDLLSLLCLMTIVSRSHKQEERTPNFSAAPSPSVSAPPSAAGNSLQDTLANLLKTASSSGGNSGPGPETLMTLLPLLNNPQIKAKMTPANMAAIMGLLNHMGAGSSDNKKAESTAPSPPPESAAPPAATTNQNTLPAEPPLEQDPPSSRYLNWKTNF
ncbi:hypothetical protein Ga0466249_002678 [Sporomusaceae bacterium BoRhaA]|uniref:hypothetical protein n=1 Tax=Pelorhabdus rhamnosifermentans TaxID=2772457 RepID=UPI001C05FBCE|nr:hypothetical protein [Pelorhabdus rhamnosifermentans]MBU2701562.1 hypothetical protein [Pelorhabdus rhamnosifermentans]